MSAMSLPDLSKKIRDIDFCMLLTKTEDGEDQGEVRV